MAVSTGQVEEWGKIVPISQTAESENVLTLNETRKTDCSDVAFLININYKPASLLQWKGFRCSSVCQPVPRPITGLHEEDTDGLSGASKVLEDWAIFGNKRKAISVCIPMREEIHWIFMTCILFITWEFTIWAFYYICWIW